MFDSSPSTFCSRDGAHRECNDWRHLIYAFTHPGPSSFLMFFGNRAAGLFADHLLQPSLPFPFFSLPEISLWTILMEQSVDSANLPITLTDSKSLFFSTDRDTRPWLRHVPGFPDLIRSQEFQVWLDYVGSRLICIADSAWLYLILLRRLLTLGFLFSVCLALANAMPVRAVTCKRFRALLCLFLPSSGPVMSFGGTAAGTGARFELRG